MVCRLLGITGPHQPAGCERRHWRLPWRPLRGGGPMLDAVRGTVESVDDGVLLLDIGSLHPQGSSFPRLFPPYRSLSKGKA
ncbi:MAG: hypothetical protein MZV70_33080 [Desulfobacterales bacterium]|nr:hypothetical protein [Desulfobacterales bacterium]